MKRNYSLTTRRASALGILLILAGAAKHCTFAAPSDDAQQAASTEPAGPPIEFFEAVEGGQLKATFIAKSDHEARLILTNNTDKPLNLKLPEAFAGVPALAQFGGGGRAGGGGGGRTGGGGGQQQSVGGGGGGQQGGGGGQFSIPPEQTKKINFPVLCLDHGLRDPSTATDYVIVPADDHLDRPAVIELLKAFGRGDLDHQAAQAAAWHLNNDLTWPQLVAKLQGTRRSLSRPPYFTRDEIQAGMAYASEATRLAVANADEYERAKKAKLEKAAKIESSDARSTTEVNAVEPASDAASESDDSTSTNNN